MITLSDIAKLNNKGIFNTKSEDGQIGFSQQNIGMPTGILSNISRQVIQNILARRTAEEALNGKQKLLNWEDVSFIVPLAERAGHAVPYSDVLSPDFVGLNINFFETRQYQFMTGILYKDREGAQVQRAYINYKELQLSAAVETLAVELNRVAFKGYLEENRFVCYGLLNHPLLENYQNAAKTFNESTWEEIMSFFANAIARLTSKTGNNINGLSKIRCVISAHAYAILSGKFTALGISTLENLKKTYPRMDFIPAIELDNAYNNQNVVYFIGEDSVGGILDTTKLGYSELMLYSRITNSYWNSSQALACGTIGCVIYKPSFIVRYNNI